MAGKKTAETETSTTGFTKEQLLVSKRYAHRKDIVDVLLKEDGEYSLDQVDTLIKEFMESEVK